MPASRARATAWIATQTGVDRAIVVPININGTTRYAVVSGPFRTVRRVVTIFKEWRKVLIIGWRRQVLYRESCETEVK